MLNTLVVVFLRESINHYRVSTLFQTDNSVLTVLCIPCRPFAPLVINFIFDRKYPGFLLNDGTDN